MQKLIKNLFKDNIFIIAISLTTLIAYLSLMKMPETDIGFGNSDKLYHLFAYFSLTICWLFSFYKRRKLKYVVLFACIIYGIIIEALQESLTEYRTGDYKDVLANTLGSILAYVVFVQILKKINVN